MSKKKEFSLVKGKGTKLRWEKTAPCSSPQVIHWSQKDLGILRSDPDLCPNGREIDVGFIILYDLYSRVLYMTK